MSADALGRGFLTGRTSYPVERYFDRLLGKLGLGEGRGRRVLDAGCGDGLVSAWLAAHGWSVQAEDVQAHPAWPGLAAAAKGGLDFTERDAATPGPGAFDLVLTKDMLHHAADPVAALKALRGRLAPEGTLLVLECNRRNPIFYLHLTLMEGHQHFTRRRLLGLFESAGLEPVTLDRVEARVWPLAGPGLQDALDRVQDFAESLGIWRPFVCYHAVSWRRPAGAA
jgi:SAM-dependent methyltransferase